MNRNELFVRIILLSLTKAGYYDISVEGISMFPSILNNDKVKIQRFDTYKVNDIILFSYKNSIRLHRILKIENNTYFCKGDNSFLLEDIHHEQIIGKAIVNYNRPLLYFNETLNVLSLEVAKKFKAFKYNIEKTKQDAIYKEYLIQIEKEYRSNQ